MIAPEPVPIRRGPGRPRKVEAEPRRKPGDWSIDRLKDAARRKPWRVRPPASIDPKRRATYHRTRGLAEDYVEREAARLALPAPAAAWTLGDWSGRWLAVTGTSADWAERTRAIYADHLWYWSPFHDARISDLIVSELQHRVAHLLTVGAERRPDSKSKMPLRPLKASVVREAVSTLERCLEAARDDGLIRSNPARRLVVPRAIRAGPAIWTAEERAGLAPVIAADDLGALWRLLIEAGLRIGEALGLGWDDLDEAAALVRVHRTVFKDGRVQEWPKSRRPREVLLTRATLGALVRLGERRPGTRWIFEAREGWRGLRRTRDPVPMSYDGVRYRLKRLCERAGVPYRPTHTGRHVQGTQLLAAGVPAADVAERLGHASAATTLRIYAHASQEGRRRALEAAEGLLDPGAPEAPRAGFSGELPPPRGSRQGSNEPDS
jgi:integrase